jgi:hypothetical protein
VCTVEEKVKVHKTKPNEPLPTNKIVAAKKGEKVAPQLDETEDYADEFVGFLRGMLILY